MTRPITHRTIQHHLSRGTLVGALAALALCYLPATDAHAGADGVLTFDGIHVASTNDELLSDSRGLGASMRVFGTREPFNLELGAFAAIGKGGGERAMRDIYDVHVNFGLNPPTKKRRLIVPFVSVGLDFLYVSTRTPDGASASGMTMGMNAKGGIFGYITDDWIYTANVSYIGAVVPGTGEGLDGVIFQVGFGKRLFD